LDLLLRLLAWDPTRRPAAAAAARHGALEGAIAEGTPEFQRRLRVLARDVMAAAEGEEGEGAQESASSAPRGGEEGEGPAGSGGGGGGGGGGARRRGLFDDDSGGEGPGCRVAHPADFD
jgi:hypothetical protein